MTKFRIKTDALFEFPVYSDKTRCYSCRFAQGYSSGIEENSYLCLLQPGKDWKKPLSRVLKCPLVEADVRTQRRTK